MAKFVIRTLLGFNKNDHPALLGNDIYFTHFRVEVFFKNPVTFLFLKGQRGRLAFTAKLQSFLSHFRSPLGLLGVGPASNHFLWQAESYLGLWWFSLAFMPRRGTTKHLTVAPAASS